MKVVHLFLHQLTVESFVVKTSTDKMILQIFYIFSHECSLFSTQLTLFRLKNSIGLKKTEFMWENVKNLQNHDVGRRFRKETKPCKTFHCAELAFWKPHN